MAPNQTQNVDPWKVCWREEAGGGTTKTILALQAFPRASCQASSTFSCLWNQSDKFDFQIISTMLFGEVEDITLEAKWRLKASKSDLLCTQLKTTLRTDSPCTEIHCVKLKYTDKHRYTAIHYSTLHSVTEHWEIIYRNFNQRNICLRIFLYAVSVTSSPWVYLYLYLFLTCSIYLCMFLIWYKISVTRTPWLIVFAFVFGFSHYICVSLWFGVECLWQVLPWCICPYDPNWEEEGMSDRCQIQIFVPQLCLNTAFKHI